MNLSNRISHTQIVFVILIITCTSINLNACGFLFFDEQQSTRPTSSAHSAQSQPTPQISSIVSNTGNGQALGQRSAQQQLDLVKLSEWARQNSRQLAAIILLASIK